MSFEKENLNNYVDANNDQVAEPVEPEEGEIIPEEDESAALIVRKLRKKLEESEEERKNNLDGWQRERADFANWKKRSEEEKKEFIKFANEALIEEIIPVLESFEMAFSNREVWESLPIAWRKGVEYIYNQLLSTLKNKGLEELDPPKGEKFNPSIHVAESSAPTFDKTEDNVIVQVVKKGYRLNGKVITPPRVVVAEYKEENNEAMLGK